MGITGLTDSNSMSFPSLSAWFAIVSKQYKNEFHLGEGDKQIAMRFLITINH